MKAADPPERKIAIGCRGETAGILGYAGREERQVGKAPAIEGKVVESTFVEQSRNCAGFGFDDQGSGRDGQTLLSARNFEDEFDLCDATDIHV